MLNRLSHIYKNRYVRQISSDQFVKFGDTDMFKKNNILYINKYDDGDYIIQTKDRYVIIRKKSTVYQHIIKFIEEAPAEFTKFGDTYLVITDNIMSIHKDTSNDYYFQFEGNYKWIYKRDPAYKYIKSFMDVPLTVASKEENKTDNPIKEDGNNKQYPKYSQYKYSKN